MVTANQMLGEAISNPERYEIIRDSQGRVISVKSKQESFTSGRGETIKFVRQEAFYNPETGQVKRFVTSEIGSRNGSPVVYPRNIQNFYIDGSLKDVRSNSYRGGRLREEKYISYAPAGYVTRTRERESPEQSEKLARKRSGPQSVDIPERLPAAEFRVREAGMPLGLPATQKQRLGVLVEGKEQIQPQSLMSYATKEDYEKAYGMSLATKEDYEKVANISLASGGIGIAPAPVVEEKPKNVFQRAWSETKKSYEQFKASKTLGEKVDKGSEALGGLAVTGAAGGIVAVQSGFEKVGSAIDESAFSKDILQPAGKYIQEKLGVTEFFKYKKPFSEQAPKQVKTPSELFQFVGAAASEFGLQTVKFVTSPSDVFREAALGFGGGVALRGGAKALTLSQKGAQILGSPIGKAARGTGKTLLTTSFIYSETQAISQDSGELFALPAKLAVFTGAMKGESALLTSAKARRIFGEPIEEIALEEKWQSGKGDLTKETAQELRQFTIIAKKFKGKEFYSVELQELEDIRAKSLTKKQTEKAITTIRKAAAVGDVTIFGTQAARPSGISISLVKPSEYARYLKKSGALDIFEEQAVLEKGTLGKYSLDYDGTEGIWISKELKKGSKEFETTVSHELVHFQTPESILFLGERFLPYRLQPAEILAFGLESPKTKYLMPVEGKPYIPKDIDIIGESDASYAILKSGKDVIRDVKKAGVLEDYPFIEKVREIEPGVFAVTATEQLRRKISGATGYLAGELPRRAKDPESAKLLAESMIAESEMYKPSIRTLGARRAFKKTKGVFDKGKVEKPLSEPLLESESLSDYPLDSDLRFSKSSDLRARPSSMSRIPKASELSKPSKIGSEISKISKVSELSKPSSLSELSKPTPSIPEPSKPRPSKTPSYLKSPSLKSVIPKGEKSYLYIIDKRPGPPPSKIFGIPERDKGVFQKSKERPERQPRKYRPTIRSAFSGLVIKPSKIGIKSGLGERGLTKKQFESTDIFKKKKKERALFI